jgi:hypothetical protein
MESGVTVHLDFRLSAPSDRPTDRQRAARQQQQDGRKAQQSNVR